MQNEVRRVKRSSRSKTVQERRNLGCSKVKVGKCKEEEVWKIWNDGMQGERYRTGGGIESRGATLGESRLMLPLVRQPRRPTLTWSHEGGVRQIPRWIWGCVPPTFFDISYVKV
eukprot:767781-Hanusia_phi.AAC.4